ncbi:MAG: hypothetical protein D6734_11055 [Candidatus Schekmanbacteria bacterium]|nr:MAG: hypothetical protein D6734_11055 [Candidatus Schekmanbacteria bacterium]
MNAIEKKIKELNDIDEELNSQIQHGSFIKDKEKIKVFFGQIEKFLNIRTQIRKEFTSIDAIELKDMNLMKTLRRVSAGEDFIADIVVKELNIKSNEDDQYDLHDQDIDDLAFSTLFSWFGPKEYIEGLIEIGVMVTEVTIPKILIQYLEEARKCYAFQQYNAVNALSRTILEIAMRDICIRKGYIERLVNHKESYKKYPPRKLIDKISSGELKKEIENLYYDKLSPTIHGFRSFLDKNVNIELRNTIRVVEKLYDLHKIRADLA